MEKKNKKFYIIMTLLIVLLIIGLTILLNIANEKILRKEVNTVVNENIDSDYKINCKSRFGYCDVEEAIKTYMNEYSTRLKEIKNVSTDKTLANILSIDNIKKDGPGFDKSIEYLKSTLSKYDTNVDKLIKMSDKTYLNNYINTYTKSKKYIELYKEIIEDENVYSKVDNSEELKKNKENVDNNIKVSIEVLEFLKKNSKNWKIESNIIKFNDYKLLDQYNAYVKKLK